jgi:hypothetical protein
MNEQTIQLLDTYATKLGTTSELLWGVLLKQAPISATADLILLAFLFLIAGLCFWCSAKCFDNDDDGKATLFCVGVVFSILFTINGACSLSSIAGAYLNPEYWALQEILRHLN